MCQVEAGRRPLPLTVRCRPQRNRTPPTALPAPGPPPDRAPCVSRGCGAVQAIHESFRRGEIARIEGTTYTPVDADVGLLLRVRAVYQDANGVLEEVYSAPTQAVANVNDAATGAPTISDTT